MDDDPESHSNNDFGDSDFNDISFAGALEPALIAPEPVADLAGSGKAERHEDARLQRIVELAEDSLARPNALEASLGLVNCELLRMARLMGPAIMAALARDVEALDHSGATQEAMESYLKVAKQVERFSQFQDRRDRDAQRAAARDLGPAWPPR
jgi:hypothetical protein